jgi:hypothetical protein
MTDPTKSSSTSETTCDPTPAQVNQILKWILAGASEFEIAEAAAAQWPGASLGPILTEAATHLVRAGQINQAVQLEWCIESTKFVYQRCIDIGDFPGALRAIKQISDLTRTTKPASEPTAWTPTAKGESRERPKADSDDPKDHARKSRKAATPGRRAHAAAGDAGLPGAP